jgi:hypothetical protein
VTLSEGWRRWLRKGLVPRPGERRALPAPPTPERTGQQGSEQRGASDEPSGSGRARVRQSSRLRWPLAAEAPSRATSAIQAA